MKLGETIESDFQSFVTQVLDLKPGTADDAKIAQAHTIFFAGAWAAMCSTRPDALRKELEAYRDESERQLAEMLAHLATHSCRKCDN